MATPTIRGGSLEREATLPPKDRQTMERNDVDDARIWGRCDAVVSSDHRNESLVAPTGPATLNAETMVSGMTDRTV